MKLSLEERNWVSVTVAREEQASKWQTEAINSADNVNKTWGYGKMRASGSVMELQES